MKRIVRSVQVAASHCGLGVFAKRPFEPSEVVGRITGTISNDPDYSSDYCMNLGDGLTLEPEAPFRFLNHSCQPNCDLVFVVRKSAPPDVPRRTMYLQALVAIANDQELTIDYGWSAEFAVKCRCGSAACRGWIVNPADLPLLADAGSET